MSESNIQARIVQLLRAAVPPVLFTSTGAGIGADIRYRVAMNRMGYTKGMPDLFIFEPSSGYHGLVIELKTHTGSVTPEQRTVLSAFRDRGYNAVVSRGFEETVTVIETYLSRKISHAEHTAPPSVWPVQPTKEKPHREK